MATNEIQGDLILLSISTVLTTPLATDFKEVVCAENAGVEGTKDVNTRRTKCGPIKGFGPANYTFNITGAANTAPTSTQISASTLASMFANNTPILVKLVHSTTSSLFTRIGQGQITRYAETANSGEVVGFDATIEISGGLTLT
jgi:hypothetical protein